MDETGAYYTERSKSERKIPIQCINAYIWNLERAVYEVAEGQTRLSDFTFTFHFPALEKEWQPTPVFLPGESQGRGSLVGCSLRGGTESDMTEAT